MYNTFWGLPRWCSAKESTCWCRRQETWVQSLSQEDPMEKEMATRSSMLAWEIPWTEEPGGLPSMGSQRVATTEWLSAHTYARVRAHTHTHTQYLLYAFSQSRDSKIQLQQIRTWEAISWGSGKTYLKVSTFFFLPNFWHCLSLTLSHP